MRLETIDSTIDPKKAAKKPSIWKSEPGMRALANHRVKALMTNVNKPKVSKVTGNDKILRIGLTKALTNPITITATRAATKLLTVNPGTIWAVISKATAVASHVNKKCFISCCLAKISNHWKKNYIKLALTHPDFLLRPGVRV